MQNPVFKPAIVCAALLPFVSSSAAAQATQQVVKPPVAQAWVDVATFSGFGMGPGMMNATLSSMMGGRNAKAEFGNTVTGVAGRWMDVTLYTSRTPSLAEATQAVPAGTQLAPTLKLQTPEKPKPAPRVDDEENADWDYEPPKGKLVMYWGCSETVRPGQPKVLDLSTATVAELGKFFESRRATKRGAHATAGRPIWPSRDDQRALPDGASIAGEHAFSGQGVPDNFRFTIPPAQDLMPIMQLRQNAGGGPTIVEWTAIPHARAYFLGTMGGLPGGENGMVIWTSSELPDSGMGLFDYQTNGSVDKWLKDKVLLPPATTRCAIPKEAASGQGMLRGIAFGTELNMAYPPRPTDPKIAWEPDWNIKIRVKSMTTTMLGMSGEAGMMGGGADSAEPGSEDEMSDAPPPQEGTEAAPGEEPKKKKKFGAFDVLKEAVKQGIP